MTISDALINVNQRSSSRKAAFRASKAFRARKAAFRAKWREEASRPQSTKVNPYPGLRSFNVNEAHIFRARTNQIEALRAALGGTSANGNARHVIMVIGGSSSGKSSIVKAGLLADIHSLRMKDGGGNWYVAECRPAELPMQEFLSALATMIVGAIFREVQAQEPNLTEKSPKFVKKVRRALDVIEAHVAPSTGPGDLRATATQSVEALLKVRLWSPRHQRQTTSVAPALALFVQEELERLDRHLHPRRAGPPRLLVSIDQFEEIFRCPDNSEKSAIFDFIRFVDQAEQQGAPELYLVASMRSEELHRCSELEGISDVVNRSVHLVELVSHDNVRQAIIEPGRLTLQGFDLLDSLGVNWPYEEKAVDVIADSYNEFAGGKADHRADALPLLQHFLRLLWDSSVGAWLNEANDDTRLTIDSASLSAIPEWEDLVQRRPAKRRTALPPDGPPKEQNRLARVLNSRADTVYGKAIKAWCKVAGDPSRETQDLARTVLKGAFISMVRQDDRRRVVRDWQSVDEMLSVSSEVERLVPPNGEGQQVERAARFERPLIAALREFEYATLIEKRTDPGSRESGEPVSKYSVFHESFIRNWRQYSDWVEEAGKASNILRVVYTALNAPPKVPVPEDIVTASGEADLSAVIGDMEGDAQLAVPPVEKSAASERTVTRSGWASQEWISNEIRRFQTASMPFDASRFLAQLHSVRTGASQARRKPFELATQAALANERAAKAETEMAAAQTKAANAEAERARAESREAEAKANAAKAAAETASAYAATAEAERKAAVTERLKAERDKKISQRRLAVVSAISCILVFCFAAIYYLNGQKELNLFRFTIAKIGLVGFEATEIGGGISRPLYRDRDLWLALNALESSDDWNGADSEIDKERNKMRGRIMHRARQVLSDLTFVPVDSTFAQSTSQSLGGGNFKHEKATCLSPSAGKEALFSRKDGRTGPTEVRYTFHNGVLQYASGKSEEFRDFDGVNELGSISELCASSDSATMLVISNKGSQPLQPYVILTQWNQTTGNSPRWYLQAYATRPLQSWSSLALFTDYPIDLTNIETSYYVSNDTVVGFVVPVKSIRKGSREVANVGPQMGVLWTNRGYSTQMVDSDAFGKFETLSPACGVGGLPESRECRIAKQVSTVEKIVGKYTELSSNDTACVDNSEYCQVQLQVFEGDDPNPVDEFNYIGRRPVNFDSDGNYLWIQSDDRIVRKFDRRPQVAKDLIASRWQNLTCELGRNILGHFNDTSLGVNEIPRFYLQKLPPYPDGQDCHPAQAGSP
ncbi:hypothetical protein [Mesorhizobium sp. WSM3859]|uniref:nSTAND1 domain-containing NTPase n=1 Tax=Mesorhizobium sp. WSM3859 TaxID=2029402 RepID=UPI000BB04512|nr:hypothetical protein [Mesorhizobium sp. WSM3859]PBC08182.1 hypothetical protein CK230_21965 [Mesorhizobium sp. WSM3859]